MTTRTAANGRQPLRGGLETPKASSRSFVYEVCREFARATRRSTFLESGGWAGRMRRDLENRQTANSLRVRPKARLGNERTKV